MYSLRPRFASGYIFASDANIKHFCFVKNVIHIRRVRDLLECMSGLVYVGDALVEVETRYF